MESNVLAKFEYNGKTYVYYRESDNFNTIKYGVLENDTIVETTDPKDIQIMNEASKKIFISSDPKNYIKLGTTMYHGKKFQQMFDEQSELKFFYEIKEGKYFVPSNEDSFALFEMFNLHDLYINQEDRYNARLFSDPNFRPGKRKKEDPIKTIIKGLMVFGISTIAVVSISACLLRTNAIEEIFKPNYEATQTESRYNQEYLIKAIDKNNNLSEEEKQVFKDQFEFVMKYSEYTDFPELSKRLETVYSEYYEGHLEGHASAGADYNPQANRIRDFYSQGFDVNNRGDFGHEAIHCCASPLCTHSGIFEATTEILNVEHQYAKDIISYGDIIAFQKVMYEIIGQEPFGRYQQSGNIKHIIKPLTNIIDDKNLANQLISSLDSVLVYSAIYNDPDNKYTEQEKQEAKQNYEENNRFIIESLSKYFQLVKGYNMDEDLIVKLILNSANITQEKIYFSGSHELSPYTYMIKKGYFVENYKNKYSDYTVIVPFAFEDGVKYLGMTIDESTRRVPANADSYYVGNIQFHEETNGEKVIDSSYVQNINGPTISQPDPVPGAYENIQESEIPLPTYTNKGIVNYTFWGHGLYEAAEEIAKRENIKDGSSKIPQHRVEQAAYFKVLYEILGRETMQKFYETKDPNIIVKALTNIIPDEDEAIDIIYDIDSISDNYFFLSSNPDDVNGLRILKNMGINIREELDKYFKAVYGYSATEDALINFYYLEVQSEISDYELKKNYINIKDKDGVEMIIGPADNKKIGVTKGVLDSNYSELFPDTVVNIYYPDQNKSSYIYISEDNRRMRSEQYKGEIRMYYFDESKEKQK